LVIIFQIIGQSYLTLYTRYVFWVRVMVFNAAFNNISDIS